MAGEVVLDPREALVRDPHPRAVAQDELPPQPAAEQEAHRIARQGAEPDDPDRQHDRGLALSGDRAAEDHHRLAREHQPHEGPGLQECREPDEHVGAAAQVEETSSSACWRSMFGSTRLSGHEAGDHERDQRSAGGPRLRAPLLVAAVRAHRLVSGAATIAFA